MRGWVLPKWPLLVWGLFLSAITAAAVSGYALVIRDMTNLMEARDPNVIWLAPALILPLVIIRSASLYLQTLATNRLALSVMRDLQTAMYARLMEADFARLQGEAAGSLVSRFTNDITTLRESLVRAANNLTRDTLQVIGGVAVMIWLDWVLALLLLLVLPVAGAPVLHIGRIIRKRSLRVMSQMGNVTSFLEETLSGARLIKTFSLENYARTRSRTAFAERFRLLQAMVRDRSKIEPLMEIAGGIALAGIFAVAGWRMATGDSDVGRFLGVIAALLIVSPALRALGSLAGAIQEGMGVLERVFNLLDEDPRLTETAGAKPLKAKGGAVALKNVRFAYDAEKAALDGVDMDVPAGKTVALVGPSGSGKTSVLNLIARLYDPQAGRVEIDRQDIAKATLASVRGSVALVSQDITLFDDTIAANIGFGALDADQAAIEAAAKAADAHDFITSLPGGYDFRAGPRGNQLSGGQRQRIAIARAILKDAPILLLDEATSALDAQSEARVQAALDRLSEGRTTLVIAHRLFTVRRADWIYVMNEGRVVEQGRHDDLVAAGGLYADLCRIQFRDGDQAT
ncbi:MAG: ABC transporter ATP-binding protein [Oceanicaulis sp.]|uniref:ABC transporter ATP-binding protein n=1 Tax=Glycocaulis sp. TaxID=1969725 RepID=UPI0025C1A569|nr:ABC transporter ATP-binding protein [Glycocaulis sp.]MCC5981677.1 ABC transporter ATP-binding protein [Oceanicaulis sp.]MCH8520511.1 ABC transporter ATP-binding protein/permease [Glycocaulis sp.]